MAQAKILIPADSMQDLQADAMNATPGKSLGTPLDWLTSTRVKPEPQRQIELDADVLKVAFNRLPFTIQHHLTGHPCFEMSSLLALARKLPKTSIEYNAGNLPVSVDPRKTPRNGLSATETVRRIRECSSWMVLKNVEQEPAYRELLETCLGEIAVAGERNLPQMRNRQAYIFVSSPGAVTPYHIDPEHNFLLQIEGSKSVSIFDPMDRELLSELALERFFSGSHRNLEFQEQHQLKAQIFQLQPGTGLHFPVAAPHWVKNGDSVSISFSITFRSVISEQREMLYKANSVLRKAGVLPVAPGKSHWRDAAKLASYRLLRRCRRAWSLASPSTGY